MSRERLSSAGLKGDRETHRELDFFQCNVLPGDAKQPDLVKDVQEAPITIPFSGSLTAGKTLEPRPVN